MISFYGGQAGQSFKIKEVFSSFTELIADINKGWKSPLAADDYVMISYGDPGSSDYETAMLLDLNNQNLPADKRKNWSSTLWQKVYKEIDLNNKYAVSASTTGMNYKFITSCVGSTSKIEAEVIETLPPGSEAVALVDKSVESGYPGKATIQFKIPGSLNIKANENITSLIPYSAPKVELKAGANTFEKILYFSLPRNAQFHSIDSITDKTSWVQGDYYFYTVTGVLYGYNLEHKTWEEMISFQPSFQQNCEVERIAAYTSSGTSNTPQVSLNNKSNSWVFKFSLPSTPIIETNYNMIGASDTGKVSVANKNNTSTITFNIPRGSRIFSGQAIKTDQDTSAIDGAKNGDIYLNTSTGKIYSLENNKWNEQVSSLKGPEGEALNIVDSFNYSSADVANTTNAIGAKIDAKYSTISNQDIFAVTYTEDNGNAIAYWFFKINNIWNRVQLTGGLSNLIENKYKDESNGAITDKTYSINYINSLIGRDGSNTTTTTYSKKQIDSMVSQDFYFGTTKSSYNELLQAYKDGKYIVINFDNEMYFMESFANNVFTFSSIKSSQDLGIQGKTYQVKESMGWIPSDNWGSAPTLHASQHSSSGSDPITPAAIGAATMTEVNAAINAAIGQALQEGY